MNIFWYDHVLFCLLGIVIPMMSLQAGWQKEDHDQPLTLPPKKHLYYNNMFLLCIGMLLCLTAWHAGENDWGLLGFQPIHSSQIVWFATVLLIILYISDTIYQYVSHKKDENHGELESIIPLSWTEYFQFLPLAIMAGISEEIMFRGYLFHYLMTYFHDTQLGPFISITLISAGFSLSHLYQGWYAVFKIFLLSLLFGIIYYFSASLLIVIVIHCCIDIISGMSGVLLASQNHEISEEENENT